MRPVWVGALPLAFSSELLRSPNLIFDFLTFKNLVPNQIFGNLIFFFCKNIYLFWFQYWYMYLYSLCWMKYSLHLYLIAWYIFSFHRRHFSLELLFFGTDGDTEGNETKNTLDWHCFTYSYVYRVTQRKAIHSSFCW